MSRSDTNIRGNEKRSNVKNRKTWIALGVTILFLALVILAVPSAHSFPNGPGDDDRPTCGNNSSCHGDVGSSTSAATITMAASKLSPTPGETEIQVTVTIRGSEQTVGEVIGVFLLRDWDTSSSSTVYHPSYDGWVITSDPNGNSPPVNYNQLPAEGSNGNSGATFVWVLTAPSTSGTYTLYSRAHLGGGEPVSIDDQVGLTFTIASAPVPEVVSSTPSDGATDVTLASLITIEFSESMDPATTIPALSTNPAIPGDKDVNNNILTLMPSAPLTASTSYTVTVSSNATSVGGVPLAANHTFEFTTGRAPDTDPPTVNSTNPADGATMVSVISPVEVTFNETMDQASVEGAFDIDPQINGSFSWNAFTLVFTPDPALDPGVNYNVTISTGALDLSGNSLAAQYEFSFTTSSGTDIVPPTILGTSPEDGASNVPLNAQVRITFSELMHKTATVSAISIDVTRAGKFKWDENTLIFTPDELWGFASSYEIDIANNATDVAGNPLEAYSFGFQTGTSADTTAPTVTSNQPSDGAFINDTSGFSISFSEAMDGPSVISRIELDSDVNGSYTWSTDQKTVTFTSNVDLTDGNYHVTLFNGAVDLVGLSVATDLAFGFIVDTVGPFIDTSTVTDGERNVEVTRTITWTFSEPMDKASVEKAFSHLPEGSGHNLNWSGVDQVRIELGEELDPNTDYNLTLSTAAMDLAGNRIAPVSFGFRTFGVPNVKGFEINTTTNVMNITFNEAMDRASVEAALEIKPNIPGTVRWDREVLMYTFTSIMRPGTTYEVTIGQTAQDVDGTTMTEPFSDHFKGPKKEEGFFTPFMIGIVFFLLILFSIFIILTWDIVRARRQKLAKGRRRAVKELEKTRHVGYFEKIIITIFSWLDERLRIRTLRKRFPTKELKHTINRQMPMTHMKDYKSKVVWYWYPLYCLGGIAFLSFIILCISGIILAFHYIPSGDPTFDADGNQGPSVAYDSMLTIMTKVPFGYILRGVHHWATHIMVAAVFLHMCRVYFVGAYRKPREMNWLMGVALLALTIALGYTGYVLPWDQLAFWAANIGLNIALSVPWLGETFAQIGFGGLSLSGTTVVRMYFLHIFVLPIIGGALMVVHMLLVWFQGIAEPH